MNILKPQQKWYQSTGGAIFLGIIIFFLVAGILFMGLVGYFLYNIKYGDTNTLFNKYGNNNQIEKKSINTENFIHDHNPIFGPSTALVTIFAFEDFECPFCSRAHETIEQVLKEYEGKIKFVRKDFPLAFHKNAMNAHLAANCAQDQKKYWEYTEKLWTNKDKLEVDNLKAYANELGFNTQEFNTCLDSQKYKSKIETDINEGQKYGVRGTPAFFINGKMLSGARPYGDFKEIIDKEL